MFKNYFLLILVLQTANIYGSVTTDSDFDGVPDAIDKCPNTAQLKKLPSSFKYSAAVNPERMKPGKRAFPVDINGCEFDSDGDGVINSLDYCPEDSKETLSKGVAENGCPKQSDADGTPDYRDNCPDTPRGVKTNKYGCAL